MFKANGGNEGSHTGLNTAISTAGGTGLKSTSHYWTSTDYYLHPQAYRVFISSGIVDWTGELPTGTILVRAVLAF